MKLPWILFGLENSEVTNNKSPFPSSFSAPAESRIVLESIWLATCRAILDVMFAFIRPVITSTDGL